MKTKYITTLITVAFFLHVIWENAQAPLYSGYESFYQRFPKCFVGTIGDAIITLLVLGFWLLIKKNRPKVIPDFIALAIIGFIIAILIEQHALLIGKWSYEPAMPIIPWLNVGLTPIIQMTALLPLSFYLAGLFNKNHHEKI